MYIYGDSALISGFETGESHVQWSTLVATILEEIAKPSGGPDEQAVKRSIINALRNYRYNHFWFNEAVAQWTTVADQQAYFSDPDDGDNDFPEDLLRPINLYMKWSDSWHPLKGVTSDQVRWDVRTDSTTGYPDEWAWLENKMYLAPVPFDAFTARMDYVKDVGCPWYRYQNGNWQYFEDESSTTAIKDQWTNPFLLHAEELIRAHAKADLFLNYYKDDANFQRTSAIVGNALKRIRRESETKKAETHMEAWYD